MKRNKSLKAILKNYFIFMRDFLGDLFDDKLGHYASSLSWSTLFFFFLLMVIMLSIFTTLPLFDSLYHKVEELIFSNLMPTDSKEVIRYINSFMENSDQLGYVGAFYVTFAAIMFFKNYDYIVNSIFETPTRSIFSAIKTYVLLLILIPLMMGSSFYITSFMQIYLDKNSITSMIHLYYFIPYFIIWMTFYITYQLSANKRIDRQAALISSFIASLIWYLSKSGFVFYVMHNKTYSSIYGSISILLFFFLWIYISWAIFLYGLKFCQLLDADEEIETMN